MTNEEAIKLIDDRMCWGRGKWSKHHMPEIDEYWQAGLMAIEALKAQIATDTNVGSKGGDTIYRQVAIDALARTARENFNLSNEFNHYLAGLMDGENAIRQLPSAQPEIIRCRDCKYWREHKYAKETKRYIPFCGFNAIYTKADDFCSRAERRTE